MRAATGLCAMFAVACAHGGSELRIDAHTDVLLPSTPERYYAPGHTSRTSIDKLERGGIGAIAMAVAVPEGPRTPEGLLAAREEANEKLAAIQAFIRDNVDKVALARSVDDIERLHRQGK